MTKASELLQAIPKLNVLVVGDICLDRWCSYDPRTSEPSRETGIPRIGVVRTDVTPGAAGTVANNLVALGAGSVMVLGAIGDDGHGYELMRALSTRSISAELSVKSPLLGTFTYTKLINAETGIEDLPRVDYISTQPLPSEVESQILANLETHIHAFDVIMVSDQAETESGGVVTPSVRSSLARIAAGHPEKIVWVDSRMRPEHFRNAVIKPNHAEACAACMRQFGAVDYQQLRRQTKAPFIVVTNGSEGVTVIEDNRQTQVRTKPEPNPVDICGAGDSFSAGAAMALAITRDPIEAARFGNMVASITIMKKGTGTASPAEVQEAERGWPA
jgi:rfaE bifunctional protein kinase chain/domain